MMGTLVAKRRDARPDVRRGFRSPCTSARRATAPENRRAPISPHKGPIGKEAGLLSFVRQKHGWGGEGRSGKATGRTGPGPFAPSPMAVVRPVAFEAVPAHPMPRTHSTDVI